MPGDSQPLPVGGDSGERFMRLFLANDRRIYGFILALVPHRADADDLMQETGAVLWRKFAEFEPGTDFAAWAMSIARFEVLRLRRAQGQMRVRFDDDLLGTLADDLTEMSPTIDRRAEALRQCLSKLPPRHRDLIRLRYEQGSTTQEVSSRVGQTVAAVYKMLNRIHSGLLECVEQTLKSEDVR